MSNCYEKFLGPEDHLHIQCLNWFSAQYPKHLWHHSPQEGKRSKFERWKFKMLGGKPGFPDWVCFKSFKGFPGLVVEFKASDNTTTKAQKEWLQNLKYEGYRSEVVYTYEAFESLVYECYGQPHAESEIHRKFNSNKK